MVSGDRVEIRPNVARNAALLAVGCLAFVVAGAWTAIGQAKLEYRFAGVLAVVFFGYGLTRIPALARRKVTLVLTPVALEQVYPQGTATIPWSDVAAVGVASAGRGRPMAGILLHSYDRYLGQMPPELAAYIESAARFMKPVAGATAVVAHGQARGMRGLQQDTRHGKQAGLAPGAIRLRHPAGLERTRPPGPGLRGTTRRAHCPLPRSA